MTTREAAHHDHEPTPGMDALGILYCALFFVLYVFYFWQVWIRWEIS